MNQNPIDHPAYLKTLARARDRARSDPGERYVVYWDGSAILLRIGAAAPPAGAQSIFATVFSNGRYHDHYLPLLRNHVALTTVSGA